MKRPLNLLCLLLALTLLGGCSVKIGGFDPAKEADKALQQVLEQLETLTDQTKDMTDAELAETIQGIAGEYHLTLNDEQMKFLISACRSLETAGEVGKAAQSVGETVGNVKDGVDKDVDTVTGLLD